MYGGGLTPSIIPYEKEGGNGMEEVKSQKEVVLERILSHRIKGFSNGDLVEREVRDIIDPARDIWYPKDSTEENPRPVLSKVALQRLIEWSGTKVVNSIIHEKQSDAPSVEREQVWIEVFVEFPDGSVNSDDGVANRSNCTSRISSQNLPIMARKRALSRAFLQSEYIGLYDVYDENESDSFSKDAKEKEEYKRMAEEVERMAGELEHGRREFAMLRTSAFQYARLSAEDAKYPDIQIKDVWFVHKDKEYMEELANSQDGLVKYVADVMLRTTIANEEKRMELGTELPPVKEA